MNVRQMLELVRAVALAMPMYEAAVSQPKKPWVASMSGTMELGFSAGIFFCRCPELLALELAKPLDYCGIY